MTDTSTNLPGSGRTSGNYAVYLRTVQRLAWDNKLAKGFNTTDVALEFGLLVGEVGEAFTAWRRRLPDLGGELADVVLYTAALAEMNGLDLATEVTRKIAVNQSRSYHTNADGVRVRAAQLRDGGQR